MVNRKYKEDQVEQWIKDYESGSSLKEIAKRANASVWTIHTRLKEREITMRPAKTPIKNIYTQFDVLNEDSTYWLGFLAADAYIPDGSTRNRMSGVILKLHEKDLEHLNKFRSFMGIEKDLIWDQGYPTLRIGSRYLSESIGKYIKIGKKSKNLNLPDLPGYLIGHFLRGYFDGDGWININKNSAKLGIVSLGPIIDSIICYLNDNNIKTSRTVDKRSNAVSVILNSKNAIEKFYDLVYASNNLRLDRKWNIVESWIK